MGATLAEMEQLRVNSPSSGAICRPRACRPARPGAFGASNLDERSYVDLVTNRFAKEQEVMTLELALLDRQVALQTLIGAGLPAVHTLAGAAK